MAFCSCTFLINSGSRQNRFLETRGNTVLIERTPSFTAHSEIQNVSPPQNSQQCYQRENVHDYFNVQTFLKEKNRRRYEYEWLFNRFHFPRFFVCFFFFSFFLVSSYFYNMLFNRGRSKINTRFTCKLKLILFITWKVLQI